MISLLIGLSLVLTKETVSEEIKEPPKPKTEIATTTLKILTPEGFLRDKAKEYGLDPDMVVEIAKCESSLKPDAVSPTHDYGLLQVNRKAHLSTMEKQGLNIYDWQDSAEYGLQLMKKEGVRPWKYSAHCHGYR